MVYTPEDAKKFAKMLTKDDIYKMEDAITGETGHGKNTSAKEPDKSYEYSAVSDKDKGKSEAVIKGEKIQEQAKQAIDQKELEKQVYIQKRIEHDQIENGMGKAGLDPKKIEKYMKEYDTLKEKNVDPIEYEENKHKYVESVKGNRMKEGGMNAKLGDNFNEKTRDEFDKLVEASGEKDPKQAMEFAHKFEEKRHEYVEKVKINRGLEAGVDMKFDPAKTAEEFTELVVKSGKVKEGGGIDLDKAAEFAGRYEDARHKHVNKVMANAQEEGLSMTPHDIEKTREVFDKEVKGAITKAAGNEQAVEGALKTSTNDIDKMENRRHREVKGVMDGAKKYMDVNPDTVRKLREGFDIKEASGAKLQSSVEKGVEDKKQDIDNDRQKASLQQEASTKTAEFEAKTNPKAPDQDRTPPKFDVDVKESQSFSPTASPTNPNTRGPEKEKPSR